MDVKEYIVDLLVKGLNDEKIVDRIKDHEEIKGKSANEILEVLDSAKKDFEIQEALKSRKEKEREEKAKAEAEKKIDSLLAEKLKSIKVDPAGKESKGLGYFDKKSGEFKSYSSEEAEGISLTGRMLKAIMTKRHSEAEAINRDIEAQNKRDTKTDNTTADGYGGYAVATPVDNKIHELAYTNSVAMQNFNTDVIMQNDKVYPVMSNVAIDWIADEETAAGQSTPAFTNPTATMYRAGAYSALSNKLIGATEADIVNAFIRSYGYAFGRFVDAQIFIGNVTGNSDLIDGLVWNANAGYPSAITLANLGVDDVQTLLEEISDEAGNVKLFGNRKVKHKLGLDESTGGMNYFPQFVGGGDFAPFGTPFVENTKITNVLDVGGDDSTGGTDTALLAVDCDAVMLGVGQRTRIDTSEHANFTKDQILIRGIKDIGYCTLHASGASLQVLELTGASS